MLQKSDKIINGQQIAEQILDQVKKEVAGLKTRRIIPKLAVVLVGEHQPSRLYIRKKQTAAEKVGITFKLHKYPANIQKERLIKEIKRIQKTEKPNGLIVQLPLPKPLYTTEVLNAINPEIDVDCMTDMNLGKLVMKTGIILPPTPGAVKLIIKKLGIDLKGKKVLIIGAGALVGKPLSIILLNKQATVTICNEFTPNVKEHCKLADIIVTAVGKPNILTGKMTKKGQIVIDTGICFVNKKMRGDVEWNTVMKKAKYITPVPGGVGPITVALLLKNTVTLTKKQNGKI